MIVKIGLGFTYSVIYCLSKMIAKSKHFEVKDVDWGDACHSNGRYMTSSYFLLYNSSACVLTLVLILHGFCKATRKWDMISYFKYGLTCGLHGTLISNGWVLIFTHF